MNIHDIVLCDILQDDTNPVVYGAKLHIGMTNIPCIYLRRKMFDTRKETNLKFYKIMAVPVLLCGSETWTLRKRGWNRIHAAELKYLRTIKGY
jgi:hypothetical protein